MPLLLAQQREKLNAWLGETGELYVYRVHGGGSGTAYFCRTLAEIEKLLGAQTWQELIIHIFRRIQYPLRGVADGVLLAEAFRQIPDGEWFHIVSLDRYYPSECVWRGGGDSHAELRRDLSAVNGQRVGIGYDPFDRDDSWTYNTPDEVMVLNIKKERGEYACS